LLNCVSFNVESQSPGGKLFQSLLALTEKLRGPYVTYLIAKTWRSPGTNDDMWQYSCDRNSQLLKVLQGSQMQALVEDSIQFAGLRNTNQKRQTQSRVTKANVN